jgi:hypothetical protein
MSNDLKPSEIPKDMHRKEAYNPMKDPFVQGYTQPRFCPIHRRNLSKAIDGTLYCQVCASESLKQMQRERVQADSAKVAREDTAQRVNRTSRVNGEK